MRIEDIILVERIALDEHLRSKKTVLEKLASLLVTDNSDLSACCIGDLFSSRERLGTTGLGGGVAIPHARISSGEQARGAVLRTINPIDFDALDDQPVDLFLALCVPEDCVNEHLDLLAKLAEAFSDCHFVENLRKAKNADVFIRQLREKIG